MMLEATCLLWSPKQLILLQLLITVFTNVPLFLHASGNNCLQLVVDSRTMASGNFSSPGWPLPYPPDAVCNYRLQGVQWEGIKITFHHFDLEAPYTAGCLSDYLELATVDIKGKREFRGRFCGRTVPAPILVLHPTVELVFRSNHAVHHSGFFATFEFIDEAYVTPPKLNGTSPCGGIVTGIGGLISSPGYPLGYSAGLDCLWLIRVPYQHAIYIRIQELEFQGSIANCQKAQLAIYDGYEHSLEETAIRKRFCGDTRYYKGEDERVLLSSRNRLLIRFTSTEPSKPMEGLPLVNVGFSLVWSDVEFNTADNCTKHSRFPCKEARFCFTKNHVGGVSKCPDLRHYCISTELVCDGTPHCGETDSSDEHNCIRPPLIITIISIPLVLLLTSFSICYVCHKRNGSRRTDTVGVGEKKKKSSCCWRRRRKGSIVKQESTFRVDLAPLPRTPLSFKHELDSPNASDIVSPASGFSDTESEVGSTNGPPAFCPTHGPLPLRYISCHFPLLPVLQEQSYQSDTYDEGGSTYSSQNSDLPCSMFEKNGTPNMVYREEPQHDTKASGMLHEWRMKQFRRVQRADPIYMSDDGKSSLGSGSSPARVCPRCLEKEAKGFKQFSRDSETHLTQFDSGIDSIENMKNVSFDTCTSSESMNPLQNKWLPSYEYEYDEKTNQSVQTDLPNGESSDSNNCMCTTVTTFGVTDNVLQTVSKATDV